jgi:hypothetical protein
MDRTASQSVDSYYADILDIPAFRDSSGGISDKTGQQVFRLRSPVPPGLRTQYADDVVRMDDFFNNSPYVLNYERVGGDVVDDDYSSILRRTPEGLPEATDVRDPSGVVPGASVLELWAGEMRALSNKEMRGERLSPDELDLLRSYQDYFSERTGMAEGGVVTPPYEQSGILGLFADKLGLSEAPPFPVPTNAEQQAMIRQSGRQDFEGRDQFYDPGAATFAERLMLEYGYPGEYDSGGNREVIDIGGEQRHSRPSDRMDLPTPQELEDVRAHMLGTALAAKGYGESGAQFMGSVNEGIFGFHQGRKDKAMDDRNNAVGLSLFKQAGIEASPQELTRMVDDAIFKQLDRIMARTPQEREGQRVSPGWEYNWRSPEGGPDVYFPRNERGYFATQY